MARERWLIATLSSIADAVVATDADGAIGYTNAAAERLVARGWKPTGEANEVIVETDRGPRVIATRVAPIVDGDSRLGMVAIARDVTDAKIAERHIELAERAAVLGTVASRLAHQVNNPLAVIVMHAESVREELVRARDVLRSTDVADAARLDDALAAHAELEKTVGDIAKIMTDVRAFSQPSTTAGQADVRRAVDWAVKATGHEFRDRARVHVNAPVTKLVDLDEPRLGQLLATLLINAARAIEPGAAERNNVTVDVRLDDPDRARIEIRDTGRGIAAPALARVFEPVFATRAGGAGVAVHVGLASARAVARAAGGDLEIDSTVGVGTLVRVVLPIAGRPGSGPLSVGERGRVLVIDDDESYLRGVRRTLRGHDVTCCATVADALEQLAAGAFDLVLAEMRMPDMSGVEMYERLQRDQPTVLRRVVFVASLDDDSDRFARFLESVPNRHVEKPMTPDALRELVREFVAARRER